MEHTIITRFTPPKGFTPMMTGVLLDGVLGYWDIFAGLLYYVKKGAVKLELVPVEGLKDKYNRPVKDYLITLKKEGKDIPEEFEKGALRQFFRDKDMVVGATRFFHEQLTLRGINTKREGHDALLKEAQKYLRGQKMLTAPIIQKRRKARGYSTLVFVATILLYMVGELTLDGVVPLPIVGAGFLIFVVVMFGSIFFKPKNTQVGSKTQVELLGYKKYLETAQKDRHEFQYKTMKEVLAGPDELLYGVAMQAFQIPLPVAAYPLLFQELLKKKIGRELLTLDGWREITRFRPGRIGKIIIIIFAIPIAISVIGMIVALIMGATTGDVSVTF